LGKTKIFISPKILRGNHFGSGEFSPILKMYSERLIGPLPPVHFSGGVTGKTF
jgi:hypothetical protein